MGLPAQRSQYLLQLEQRCARKADDLTAVVDHGDALDPPRTDDHDRSVVTAGSGSGPSGKPRIRGLQDDRRAEPGAHFKRFPQFDQRSRPRDRQRISRAGPETGAVKTCAPCAGQ